MNNNDNQRPIFRASVDTLAIAKVLASAQVGQTISYAEIVAAAGATKLDAVRGKISSARRILLRDEQKCFHAVTGIGIQRSGDVAVIQDTRRKTVSLRRRAHRVSKELATVNPTDQLPPDKKQELFTLQAIIGAVSLTLSAPSERIIIRRIKDGQRLEIGDVEKLFEK